MGKLKPEDLDKISQKMRKIISLREGIGRAKIIVHMGTCGIAAGARNVMNVLPRTPPRTLHKIPESL